MGLWIYLFSLGVLIKHVFTLWVMSHFLIYFNPTFRLFVDGFCSRFLTFFFFTLNGDT